MNRLPPGHPDRDHDGFRYAQVCPVQRHSTAPAHYRQCQPCLRRLVGTRRRPQLQFGAGLLPASGERGAGNSRFFHLPAPGLLTSVNLEAEKINSFNELADARSLHEIVSGFGNGSFGPADQPRPVCSRRYYFSLIARQAGFSAGAPSAAYLRLMS